MAKELSRKQEIFVAEYAVDQNATRAYIAAGYSGVGAAQSASRLLRNAKVWARVDDLHSRRLEKLDISADRVLAELARLAFFDPRKFFNPDGSTKQIADLDDDTAAALAGMEVCELFEGNGDQKHAYGLSKKFKLADKLRALELLGKHLKLFTDKVEVTGEDGGPLTIAILDDILASHGSRSREIAANC